MIDYEEFFKTMRRNPPEIAHGHQMSPSGTFPDGSFWETLFQVFKARMVDELHIEERK